MMLGHVMVELGKCVPQYQCITGDSHLDHLFPIFEYNACNGSATHRGGIWLLLNSMNLLESWKINW